MYPNIAIFADGRFIIVWISNSAGDKYDVYG